MAVQTQDDDEWSLVSATTLFTALPPDAFVVISEFLGKADRTAIRATCSTVWNGLSFHFKLRFSHWEDVARFVRQQPKMKKLSTKDDIEPLAPRQCSELSIGQAVFSRQGYKGKDAARLAELLKVACCSAVKMDGTTECTLQKLTLPWDDSLNDLSSCLSQLQTKNLYSLTLGSSDTKVPQEGFFNKAWCQNLTKLSFFSSNVSFFPLPRTLRVVELGFQFSDWLAIGHFTQYFLQRESMAHLEEVWYTQNRDPKLSDWPCYANFLHTTRPKVDGRTFQVKVSIANPHFTLKQFRTVIVPLLAGAKWILVRGSWDTWFREETPTPTPTRDEDEEDLIMSLLPSLESATRVVTALVPKAEAVGILPSNPKYCQPVWSGGTAGKIPLNVIDLKLDFQTALDARTFMKKGYRPAPDLRKQPRPDIIFREVQEAPETLQRLYLSFAHPSCTDYWATAWVSAAKARLKLLSELVIELREVTAKDLAWVYFDIWSRWNTGGSVLKVVLFVARKALPSEEEVMQEFQLEGGWSSYFEVAFGRLPEASS